MLLKTRIFFSDICLEIFPEIYLELLRLFLWVFLQYEGLAISSCLFFFISVVVTLEFEQLFLCKIVWNYCSKISTVVLSSFSSKNFFGNFIMIPFVILYDFIVFTFIASENCYLFINFVGKFFGIFFSEFF